MDDNNHKRWLDALVHIREARREFGAIHVQCQDGFEKAVADTLLDALNEPYTRAWQYIKENCTLEEIASRNL